MPTTTTKAMPAGAMLGDLVRNMYHPGYCLESATLVSPAGAVATPGVRLLGQPVKASGANYVLVLGGDIANAAGVVADDNLYDLPAAGGLIGPISILRRGPAQYGAAALPANDVLGTGITPAAFLSALSTNCNPPLIPVQPLTPTKVQTN